MFLLGGGGKHLLLVRCKDVVPFRGKFKLNMVLFWKKIFNMVQNAISVNLKLFDLIHIYIIYWLLTR